MTASWFRPAELFAVTDVASAVAALELVVQQGEGTATSPVDVEGDPAHYYRFSEIKHGHRLVVDSSAPGGFSYSGDQLDFDASKVWPLVVDPKPERYKAGTVARRLVDEFNRSYTTLLKALHRVADGDVYLDERATSELLKRISGGSPAPASGMDSLADRELEVFQLVGRGYNSRKIAEQLINSLAGPFDPDKYRDSYREQVLALIDRKAQGEQIAVQPTAEEDEAPVPDWSAFRYGRAAA